MYVATIRYFKNILKIQKMSTFTHPTTNVMSGFTIGVFPKLVFIFVLLIKTVLWIEPKLPNLKFTALSYQPNETVMRVAHHLFCQIKLVDQNRQGRLTLGKTTLLLDQ